ncbi:SRPBCC domain-containing protein [Lentisphaera marina]|uniref:SRPBCC family protein n=1 Tax=Lentisphaera marina TaxID=1111041 RepID=UPI00236642F9|nr:SRPBCC domain-containing protein [Lentisphaera marina]MDD7984975.1 SRPBCC domain-containing protein [Lentisphaera marina]
MQFEYISFISAKVEKVWQFFKDPHLFSQFQIAPLHSFSFQEKAGFSLGTDSIHVLKASYDKIETNKLIQLKLTYAEVDGESMDVKIIFYPLNEMSSLSIIIDNLTADDPRLDVARNHWPGAISQLKSIIETGQGLPWPQK